MRRPKKKDRFARAAYDFLDREFSLVDPAVHGALRRILRHFYDAGVGESAEALMASFGATDKISRGAKALIEKYS